MFLSLKEIIILMAGKSESQVKAEEEYREFLCKEVYKGCGFQVRAKTEDEVIEQAHMHQELAHGVKEPLSETREKIKGMIRPVKVNVTET
jgi:predicted small metal-binding protein